MEIISDIIKIRKNMKNTRQKLIKKRQKTKFVFFYFDALKSILNPFVFFSINIYMGQL